MSRPPSHHNNSTTDDAAPGEEILDYLPDEFAHFLDMQEVLALGEFGTEMIEGDFAATLADANAVLAHILSVYQDHYANEAFIGTAQTLRSLVWHGRRLAYEPDPGLAATGYLVIRTKDNVTGTVDKGLQLGSKPLGEDKAKHYETLEAVRVDADYNDIRPSEAIDDYRVSSDDPEFYLDGVDYELEPGNHVVITGFGAHPLSYQVDQVSPRGETTYVRLGSYVPADEGAADAAEDMAASELRLWGRPQQRFRLWGWQLESELSASATLDVPDEYAEAVLLEPAFDGELAGAPVTYLANSEARTFVVERAGVTSASYTYTTEVDFPAFEPADDDTDPQLYKRLAPTAREITHDFSGKVTGIEVGSESSNNLREAKAEWIADWQMSTPLVSRIPSEAPAPVGLGGTQGAMLQLAGYYPELEPGRLVYLSTLDFQVEAIAEIVALEHNETAHTSIELKVRETSDEAHDWELGDLRINANVARISHGKSRTEVLGDSDGVTAFQSFELEKSPLTHLPSPEGSSPALEVRVDGIQWERVEDFYESGPEDLHFALERDEDGNTHVKFGDGKRGAIPSSGRNHIRAEYRHGLGVDGNVAGGRVSRIKKAHPLVDRVVNPFDVRGGTAPAQLEDVRHQATRYIETFDRAVSVEDHARLALLYPGVARARARWGELEEDGRHGVILVASSANGLGIESQDELEAFLRARRSNEIPLAVEAPIPRSISLEIRVSFDARFPRDAVGQAIRDAMHGHDEASPGMFTFAGRRLGQSAFSSEVYERLEAIDGLERVELTLFAPEGQTEVADAIYARPGEWLQLVPSDLIIHTGGTTDG